VKKIAMGFLIPFLIIFGVSGVSASEAEWVTCSGEAFIQNITPEEAQELAIKKARLDAIEEVCGISLQAETIVRDMAIDSDFIHAFSYGHILSEEPICWGVDIFQESPKHVPLLMYKVTMKVEVLKEEGEPDPFYRVDVRLNNTVFQSGDDMIIHVKPTKASYITVLNFASDNRVYVLFPNQIRRKSYVEAGRQIQLPSRADCQQGVYRFQVTTLPGHRRNREFVKVIATRDPINLFEGLSLAGHFGVMEAPRLAVTEIARWLSSIPVRDRAEATVTYEVVSREVQ